MYSDIPVIKPTKFWSLDEIVRQAIVDTSVDILPQHQDILDRLTGTGLLANDKLASAAHSSQDRGTMYASIDWASAPDSQGRKRSTKKSNPPPTHSHETNQYPSTREMEIDDEDLPPRPITPPPARDPRDDLQDQLASLLTSVLPSLVKDSIEVHNKPSDESIHAISKSRHPSRRSTRQKLPSVSSVEWKAWSLYECILFLLDYPPPPSHNSPLISNTKEPASPFPEKVRLGLQSLALLIRQDRKGREFGRGDWERATLGLATLWPSVQEPFAQAVKDVFEG